MHIKGNEVTYMYVLVFTQRINVLVIVNQTDHIDIYIAYIHVLVIENLSNHYCIF